WSVEKEHLASPTWPIVQSAMQLLIEGDARRIKLCPGVPGDSVACAWLFYDESKNGSRRWCSMADCGSGAKARRLTDRRRAARAKRSS
ncbi:MAG: CGNR zinc finger domain-containing protein, partial [Chloroflexi bacterium]|nr:CGNR zinc finger domain-containing protein [Chloroflexota bacterium]